MENRRGEKRREDKIKRQKEGRSEWKLTWQGQDKILDQEAGQQMDQKEERIVSMIIALSILGGEGERYFLMDMKFNQTFCIL